jgi:hypothetical protein
MSASRVAPIPPFGVAGFKPEVVAGFNRQRWQASIGSGGRFRPEAVAGFNRKRWQVSTGIRNYEASVPLSGWPLRSQGIELFSRGEAGLPPTCELLLAQPVHQLDAG